jgi:hypothetical protein
MVGRSGLTLAISNFAPTRAGREKEHRHGYKRGHRSRASHRTRTGCRGRALDCYSSTWCRLVMANSRRGSRTRPRLEQALRQYVDARRPDCSGMSTCIRALHHGPASQLSVCINLKGHKPWGPTMKHRRTLIGALALSTALAASACAAATAYTAPANADAYNVECYYDLTDECAPYVYGPSVVFGHGDLQHFDHFHDHPTHVVHGLGARRAWICQPWRVWPRWTWGRRPGLMTQSAG